ncbi:uroporphyrinogen-III synthase [Labrys monachus]|uniref:Uroporphyrinogen-III synthase n=1 Tax=Labrys monachus TaxID=217067 RepID=A0ABU0FMY9_9HYPH|nr:uroporphyrinogen-III synthase [Labrys monachus]MDQ0395974.1 uroporphyrinogen-III synthase [Labrys monachus]
MARILVTRPIEESRQTARALAERGHEALIDPMLTVTPRDDALPEGPFDTVVVTSGNALAAIRHRPELADLLAIPLVAVGRRTAAAARALGFADVETTGRDLDALLDHAARAWPTPRRILYLAGADRSGDLPAALAAHGHHVRLAVVYEAHKAERFAPATAEAIAAGGIDAVLHYSARTAEAFIACAGGPAALAALGLRHLCLSAKVAAVLAESGAGHVASAPLPEEEALLDLI